MKFVTIKNELLQKYYSDKEVLLKAKRPYVVIIQLRYKNNRYDFAIPLRSNIPSTSPKNEYFPLPPRSSTKPKNHHGLHYIKMFPVAKRYYVKYRCDDDFSILIQNIINKNIKRIVNDCQEYLNRYSLGEKPVFSTDLDSLLTKLNDLEND